MTVIGFSCVRGRVSLEEHRECMLSEAPCGFSPTVLEMMIRPTEGREGVQFSPSSIAGCHRQHALQADHDWYLDPEKAYSSTRGTLVHFQFRDEPAPAGTLGVVRELRMNAPIKTRYGEQHFSGQVDEILLLGVEVDDMGRAVLHVSITDWKTKADVPHSLLEAEKRHVHQINQYAWLASQILKDYLNGWEGMAPKEARLRLNVDIPTIDQVVVDGLSVVYLSMSKQRTFTTGRLLYAKGKQRTELGSDGKYHRVDPIEHETLELVPLHEFSLSYTESIIRKGIEVQIEGQQALAAPLEGDDASRMCPSCGVRDTCIALGKAQGYDMVYQEAKRAWYQISNPRTGLSSQQGI